jgi:hypothetical protein
MDIQSIDQQIEALKNLKQTKQAELDKAVASSFATPSDAVQKVTTEFFDILRRLVKELVLEAQGAIPAIQPSQAMVTPHPMTKFSNPHEVVVKIKRFGCAWTEEENDFLIKRSDLFNQAVTAKKLKVGSNRYTNCRNSMIAGEYLKFYERSKHAVTLQLASLKKQGLL